MFYLIFVFAKPKQKGNKSVPKQMHCEIICGWKGFQLALAIQGYKTPLSHCIFAKNYEFVVLSLFKNK